MKFTILRQTSLFLHPGFVVLSLWVLYRGHNLPGGGFIGGLLLAGAFILLALAHGLAVAERKLPVSPVILLASGLLVCLLSALPGMFTGQEIMKGLWLPAMQLPLLGSVHIGTPLLFDIGVYLAVAGFCLKVFFSFLQLNEEETWNS